MAELLAKKEEIKLLLSITNGRLGYLGVNENKMRFWGAKKRGKSNWWQWRHNILGSLNMVDNVCAYHLYRSSCYDNC